MYGSIPLPLLLNGFFMRDGTGMCCELGWKMGEQLLKVGADTWLLLKPWSEILPKLLVEEGAT